MDEKPPIIQIVDDDLLEARLLEAQLKADGYATLRAASGEEAMQQWQQTLPDLVLLDILMPGLSGYEVAEKLRQDERTRNIPVIVITALEDRESRLKCLQLGVEEFLTKPVDRAELWARVKNLLRLKEYQNFLANHNEILEREVAERTAQLESNEKRFRGLIENSSDLVMVLDQTGAITYASPSITPICGYAVSEMLGTHYLGYLLAEDEKASTANLSTIIGDSNPAVRVVRHFRRKDGSVIAVELIASNMLANPDIRGIVVNGRDVTDRERAEAEIRESEARYGTLFDNMLDGFALCKMLYQNGQPQDFIYIMVNPAFETLTGLKNVVGRKVSEVIPGIRESNPELLERYANVVASGDPDQFETYVAQLDIWFKLSVYTTQPEHFVAIVNNITERKRGEIALRRVNRALSTISQCNTVLVRANDETQLLDDMCRLIINIGGYRLSWVGYALDDEQKTVRPVANAGYEAGYMERAVVSWSDTESGRGPVGTAIRTHEVSVVDDALVEPRYQHWRANAVHLGYRSIAAFPLLFRSNVLGTLAIYSVEPNGFDADELKLLRELADDLAFGIGTLRIRVEHENNAARLLRAAEATILAMAATVEMRDPYTAGHQRRVADLSTAIARELELPEDDIQGIHFAAVIHDLGKIKVPAEILSKPSRLTSIEFELIKSHAQAGYEILKPLDFPWRIADMVHQHHERMDGKGYPQGLKEGQILLGARIIAVADTVEAMSSHRPYRPGLGIDAALGEIVKNRGSLYDSAAVDACVKLFREKQFSFSK